MTLAEELAHFATGLDRAGLPADVAGSVRSRVLDVVGLCVAALDLPTSAAALDFVADQGGHPQATVIGGRERVSAPLAAFANGVLAHSLDYDDTHLPSVLHPSASVVPAGLAAAELVGAGGAELTVAVAAGLEICVRLGMAGYDPVARNSTFFQHGQHATSICGTIGGAVTAGLLLDLDADRIRDVIGVAASMASGLIEANRTGGTVKRLHCGWAAQAGVTAALLVRNGLTGPPTVLEGRFGFFEAFLRGEYDPAPLRDGLGHRWEVPGIFFKPYPANHFTHAVIDAARALRADGLRPDQVASARVGVPAPVLPSIGQPIEAKRTPQTGYQAQFSGPYAVAAGLFGAGGGLGVGLADFTDELARDPGRRALMARVEVVADDKCTEIFPFQFPARLDVRTTDGRELVAEVYANRGGPQWPLTPDELAAKFTDNAGRRLPAAACAGIAAALRDLDAVTDLRAVLALTGKA